MLSIPVLSILIFIVLIVLMAYVGLWTGMIVGFGCGALLLIPLYLLNRRNSRENISDGDNDS